MIPLGFLIFSTLIVITLIKSLIKLFNTDWDKEQFTAMAVIRICQWPLILLVLFLAFIFYGVPALEEV